MEDQIDDDGLTEETKSNSSLRPDDNGVDGNENYCEVENVSSKNDEVDNAEKTDHDLNNIRQDASEVDRHGEDCYEDGQGDMVDSGVKENQTVVFGESSKKNLPQKFTRRRNTVTGNEHLISRDDVLDGTTQDLKEKSTILRRHTVAIVRPKHDGNDDDDDDDDDDDYC